ncbi:MAG: hemolysin family protein [Janthinobacterium lividum]
MAIRLIDRLFKLLSRKNSDSIRETITELIQETPSEESSLNFEERALLSNVLSLRDLSVDDVKIPRADIIAVPADISYPALIKLMSETPFTRLPVYQTNLDDIVGHIHVKDIALHVQSDHFDTHKIIQQVLFVPHSMRLLDLFLQMRATQIPMACVVDEYGGIDGLVTSWDIIREILGDLQDDHTPEISSQITKLNNGAYVIDARVSIKDLEDHIGKILTQEERDEDIDTVGGLIMYIAGRVPHRKEVISHASGIDFEVIEASPRSINRVHLYPVKPQ